MRLVTPKQVDQYRHRTRVPTTNRPPSFFAGAVTLAAALLGVSIVDSGLAAAQTATPPDTACAAATTPPDGPGQSAGIREAADQAPAVEDMMHTRVPLEHEPEHPFRLALSTAALAVRYRYLETGAAGLPIRQLQVSEALRGVLRIDRKGRFSVHGGIASGRGFSGGWNTTGAGTGTATYDVSPKQLFASVRLAPRIDFEAGGLYFTRGQSSEATTSDNDGYIVGERVVGRRPWAHVFDEFTLTRAYLGDLLHANVFARLHALDQANYYQALVQRIRPRPSRSAAMMMARAAARFSTSLSRTKMSSARAVAIDTLTAAPMTISLRIAVPIRTSMDLGCPHVGNKFRRGHGGQEPGAHNRPGVAPSAYPRATNPLHGQIVSGTFT